MRAGEWNRNSVDEYDVKARAKSTMRACRQSKVSQDGCIRKEYLYLLVVLLSVTKTLQIVMTLDSRRTKAFMQVFGELFSGNKGGRREEWAM